MPTTAGGAYVGMSENVREQVARTLTEFGLEPKGRARMYRNPTQNSLTPFLTSEVFGFQISLSLQAKTLRLRMNMSGSS
jgi:hypothetical protein